MKRFMSIFVAGLLFFGAGATYAPVLAKSKDNVTVNVDGIPMTIVGHPAVLDEASGRVMIPFKSLFLAIGVQEKDIKWDAATSTAKGTRDGISVELTKNSKIAKVNGETVEMDVAPVIMGTSTMVPISFVTKQMGGVTKWKGNPDYVVDISISYGLFPFDPDLGTGGDTGNTGSTNTSAPAKDTGTKNSDVWGTWAMQNMNKEKLVAQFRSDYTVNIKNLTTKKVTKGTYTVSGSNVNVITDIVSGNFKLDSTKYNNTTYYILNSTDSSKTVAMTAITYDEFASVY